MGMPIISYETQEQLDISLNEWQTRLGLQDWVIKAIIVEKTSDGEDDSGGLNTRLPVEKECVIEIKKGVTESYLGGIMIKKRPQELTLVHELLHCHFSVVNAPGTYECQIAYWYNHSLLDTMAKALIMAKYNITIDWFK